MPRRYARAPISEAVCQFLFSPREPWDLTVPGLVYGVLKNEGLTERQLVRRVETHDVPEGESISKQVRLDLWMRLLKADGKAFAQLGPDMLSVNHLEPYPGWEQFKPLISACFSAYRDVADPKGLKRIGLRYINQISLESRRVELADYFLFRPHLSPDLPEDHGRFRVVVEFPFEGGRDVLRVQLGTGEPTSDALTLVLDLDYFMAEPEAVGLDSALAWVESAHGAVEAAFEGSITDQLRQLLGIVES
jgi:uncharacterized protein (TIGR04255 family)